MRRHKTVFFILAVFIVIVLYFKAKPLLNWMALNKAEYELNVGHFTNSIEQLNALTARRRKVESNRFNNLMVENLLQTAPHSEEIKTYVAKLKETSLSEYYRGIITFDNNKIEARKHFEKALALNENDELLDRSRIGLAGHALAYLSVSHNFSSSEVMLPTYTVSDRRPYEKQIAEFLKGYSEFEHRLFTLAEDSFKTLQSVDSIGKEMRTEMALNSILAGKMNRTMFYVDDPTTHGTVANLSALKRAIAAYKNEVLNKGRRFVLNDTIETDRIEQVLSDGEQWIDLYNACITETTVPEHMLDDTHNGAERAYILAKFDHDVEAYRLLTSLPEKNSLALDIMKKELISGTIMPEDYDDAFTSTAIYNLTFGGVPASWNEVTPGEKVEWNTTTEINIDKAGEYRFYCIACPHYTGCRGITLKLTVVSDETNRTLGKSTLYFDIPQTTIEESSCFLPVGKYRINLGFEQNQNQKWLDIKSAYITIGANSFEKPNTN